MRWARWAAAILVTAAVVRGQGLARAVQAAEALGARTGVAVVDDRGQVLYQHRATESFAPASNMKLLTAAAVLQGLGADYHFTTRFRLRRGRLVVEASGDPNWISGTAHGPEQVFGEVVAALQQRGVTALAGIDLEAGAFTGPGRPDSWPKDQLFTYYCAPTGPFVLEQGTFSIALRASGGSHAAAALAAPPAGTPLRGSIALAEAKKDATYGAVDQGDAVLVRGQFPRRSPPVTIRTAVREPAAWYEASLRHLLREHGIRLDDPAAALPDGDVVLLDYRTELRTALLRMLEDSSNFDAEQCLRVLGKERLGDGSLQGGVRALGAEIAAELGAVPNGVALVDGSGLSKDNRLTPGLLVVQLFRSASKPGGAVLRDCLPIAGRTGTLADRFRGSDLVDRVRAKTGWIRGASALSGLVEGRDGRTRYFAILMNYEPRKDGLNRQLKDLQEQIVAAVDALREQ